MTISEGKGINELSMVISRVEKRYTVTAAKLFYFFFVESFFAGYHKVVFVACG